MQLKPRIPRVRLRAIREPMLGGVESCRLLQHAPQLNECSVIMVSAKAMEYERAEGFDAGADKYLTKPFDDATLLSVIKSVRRDLPPVENPALILS
jgi:DNA-binding response OmpR family regulator